MPWYLGNSRFFTVGWGNVIAGLSLWHAARRSEKVWFVTKVLLTRSKSSKKKSS